MSPRTESREIALGGLLGAAALLLPALFHLVHLGSLFMPMYVPLCLLAFLASARIAATTALITPLMSGLLTGMPPLYPPIAPVMSVELALMCGTIALARTRWPRCNEWLLLFPVLLAGRIVNFCFMYAVAQVMNLPPGFVAGLSFIAGWPGVVLMLLVLPPLVRMLQTKGTFLGHGSGH
jgi:hypothetical protein